MHNRKNIGGTLILMCDNREPIADKANYVSLSAYGNYKYAHKQGYAFAYVKPLPATGSRVYCHNPRTGAQRFVAWAKILATHHMLKKYDRVVYVDSDAFFNTEHNLDTLLHSYRKQSRKTLFCTDHPFNPKKPNTGFFICHRNDETLEFLRSWYSEAHNEDRFDTQSTWEQASLFSYNLTNTELAEYYSILPINQFKMKNFKSGYAWQKFNNTADDDTEGGRLLINHYFMKKPDEMREDLLKMYDMHDFNEVLRKVQSSVIPLETSNYQFLNMSDLTVIISGSHIDTHPDISGIVEVIESLKLGGIDANTPIILMHDKINPEASDLEEKENKYNEYFKNLQNYLDNSDYKHAEIVQSPQWGHLTRGLKHAIGMVKTKYVFVLQHDIHIRREIPILEMLRLMEKYKHIKHLRFNVRKNLPTFMWWDGYKDGTRLFAEEEYDGVKVCVTPAWSDQNHLATKEYYENVVFPDCTNSDGELIYDFMENRLNGMCHHNHTRYGTYIYGEYGAPRTSRHSDGRKSSPEADED